MIGTQLFLVNFFFWFRDTIIFVRSFCLEKKNVYNIIYVVRYYYYHYS